MSDTALVQSRALDPRYYTAPEVFAQARDKLFFKSWQFACHSSRLPGTGDYFAFSILDQDFFVIQGRDGMPRCFFNVCQHRGHVLGYRPGPLVVSPDEGIDSEHSLAKLHGWLRAAVDG